MRQESLLPDEPAEEQREYRQARAQLVWPPTVKNLVKECSQRRRLSMNEWVLRYLVAGLVEEGAVDQKTAQELLRTAPTQPCKEFSPHSNVA
jgi:hypothetical protein